ncbi:hypothetical protein HYH02_011435 [Chlamydomonas schloesseri]|uniref:Major facilitator superfamily (MFS) profile domain-containing protein n=1 Tax=Chlamydomonas schloesseri TaxID=2026947 RepID=A0A835T1A6_9CHLO|nr:hypothetical protein HYH02_011435 [Chlamydomonas schloesseri]|eukprot:KAG2437003.1 hypothetical protein HYH02_011435 [Chlamydomonas schloesseri]
MQTATQRQPRLCGGVGRRFLARPPRPGVRTCVIVPSKGSASGSSDKRLPPAWLLGSADKKVLQDMRSLESLIQRDAPEPEYAVSAADTKQPLDGTSEAGSHDMDPDALKERLASAAQASTSTPNAVLVSSSHHDAAVPEAANSIACCAASRPCEATAGDAALSSPDASAVSDAVGMPPAAATTAGAAAPSQQLASASSSNQQLNGVANGPAAGGPAAPAPMPAGDTAIPGSIWILCCISAALTCASCVFNTALPIYMVSELKMSMRSMGMFEGLLEAFSYVVRMCSGVVSDRMSSRKAAITLGFAAGAMAKFGMASAGTVGLLFAGKAVDRLANGIQAAPRDALIGDLSPPGVRSACFGLAQSLRKWGSAVGALAAFFLMKASNNNYQLIFYSAATVSLAACIAFVLFVPAHTRTPTPAPAATAVASTLGTVDGASSSGAAAAAAPAAAPGPFAGAREFFRSVASMGSDFYRMLGVICLYALGHINESLLEARAMEVGFGKAEATLVVAALAAVTFLTAFPLGRLDDKYGAGTTFAVGISALIAGDLVLLLSGPHPMALFAACAFLGVHWAVIQGPLLSIVSGLAPAHLRGTAFGIFYTVMAVTAVAANTMYGSIWHTYGANAAFATSAALMTCVLVALPHMLPAAARRGAAAAAAGPAAAPAAAPAISLPLPGSGDSGKGPAVSPMPAAA